MKALLYNGPRDPQVRDVPDANLERPTDVVVEITSTNIADLIFICTKGVPM